MQFQVPQFIEIEDKIIGPLTLKQFLYVAGAAAFSFIFFFMFEFWLWAIVSFFLGVFAIMLAFAKINGRPFLYMFIAMFNFAWRPKFYLWNAKEKQGGPNLTIHSIPKASAGESKNPLGRLLLKIKTGSVGRSVRTGGSQSLPPKA